MRTHFTGAFRTISTLSILSLAGMVGCGLLKRKDDEVDAAPAPVAEAVDAAPVPAAAPVASNVDDVARFPDEKPLENVVATIQRPTNVREIPSVGKVVAALAKGGTVTEIAQRGTAFLVVFENPKAQKKLMGWVGQEAFTAQAQADAGIKPLACTAPEVPLVSDGPFCGRVCAGDTDCPAGQACKGAANKLNGTKTGDAVTVCTIFSPPAAKVEPGRAVVQPAPVAVTLAIPNVDIAAPTGGRCPAGFTLVAKDGQCHKNCAIGQCRAESKFCVPCGGVNVCATNKEFCK